MPLLSDPALLYKSLQIGLRLGLEQAGLQNARLALAGAMTIALEPDAFERWLDGEPVFEKVEYPEETEEGHSLTRFARQAKGQARAERRSMQQVVSAFLETPGAWALYSTSGVEPRRAATPG